jgi:site-specific recombinase XerD
MEQIISEIIMQMTDLPPEQGKKLENVLYGVFAKYDITPKSTEVRAVDNSWQHELEWFLSRKRIAGKSERTIKLYNMQLRRVLIYLNKAVKDITENDLSGYMSMYRNTRHVSNVYLDNIRLIMSSFFGWMHRKGMISKNPASGLDPIKIEKKIKKPFSDEDLENLKITCKRERDLALIEFLYATGVRVSELAALNRTDIDFDGMDVIVFGKGGKERETYLTATSCMHLRKYLQSRKDNNNALFASVKAPHNRMTVSGIEQIIKSIGKRAGIEKTHPHRFRRTMATNVLKKGMPLEEVRELLGHVKLDTTMIYCTVSKDNVRNSHRKYMCA